MGGTHALTMGDRGRLVIPAEVRSDLNWEQGTRLILIQTGTGASLMSIDQARALIKAQIGDRDLVAELIAERHTEAQAELDKAAR
ncbi:MAG: AbrB/MazE/SpoVT family DNA-binding domain-containing protein [Actinobacteria bacterium]|nr:AbrB/MazE/SpoVT family DNA-binding domain-containing protein [Actinomycetota bacterium]